MPGKVKKLTIDQIAKLAYVSRSVVSRVLNNHPNVSPEARERVMKVIKEQNYTPSSTARSLATDRTQEISILAPRKTNEVFANAFWSLVFLGISEQSIRRGYFVSLSMISRELEDYINDRILYGRSFDGYILITREVADHVMPALRKRDMPAVLIGHDPAFPDLSSVDVDNYDGAYQATRHLCAIGHECIATIMGAVHTQESRDRLRGYKQALRDAGCQVCEDRIMAGDYSQRRGYELMQDLLAREPRPTAVFCACDAMAVGALLALHEAGIAVPEEMAIVGFDDLPTSQYTCPPLTTIRQPIYKMAGQAADLVIDQIEGKTTDVVHVKLGVELVVRQSCGARVLSD